VSLGFIDHHSLAKSSTEMWSQGRDCYAVKVRRTIFLLRTPVSFSHLSLPSYRSWNPPTTPTRARTIFYSLACCRSRMLPRSYVRSKAEGGRVELSVFLFFSAPLLSLVLSPRLVVTPSPLHHFLTWSIYRSLCLPLQNACLLLPSGPFFSFTFFLLPLRPKD